MAGAMDSFGDRAAQLYVLQTSIKRNRQRAMGQIDIFSLDLNGEQKKRST